MLGTPGDKPAKSLWPTFGTPIYRCTIIMKTNNNNVDLEFPGMGKRLYDLELKLSEIGVEAKPIRTGKSAIIRCSFDETNSLIFSDDFDSQIEKLEKWLHKVLEFDELAKSLYQKGLKTIDF